MKMTMQIKVGPQEMVTEVETITQMEEGDKATK